LDIPVIPLRVISLEVRPGMAWLNVRVNCVVVCDAEPLAVTLLKVTAVNAVTVTLTGPAVTVKSFRPPSPLSLILFLTVTK
jgi:hypothetical protein